MDQDMNQATWYLTTLNNLAEMHIKLLTALSNIDFGLADYRQGVYQELSALYEETKTFLATHNELYPLTDAIQRYKELSELIRTIEKEELDQTMERINTMQAKYIAELDYIKGLDSEQTPPQEPLPDVDHDWQNCVAENDIRIAKLFAEMVSNSSLISTVMRQATEIVKDYNNQALGIIQHYATLGLAAHDSEGN